MSRYKLGTDVMVQVEGEHTPPDVVLHYGTVYKTKQVSGSARYRVSGLPRVWFPAWRLSPASGGAVIKARARVGELGQDAIFLGLDGENVRRLMDNKPIMFDGAEVGVPGVRFVILAGETLGDIQDDLRALGLPIPRRAEKP